MFVAKVTGHVVCTQKVDAMVGYKLLLVEPYRLDPSGKSRENSGQRTAAPAVPAVPR